MGKTGRKNKVYCVEFKLWVLLHFGATSFLSICYLLLKINLI